MARKRNYQISKRWNVGTADKVFASSHFSGDFIKLLAQRGLTSEQEALDFINPKYSDLSDPFDLPDMDKAVNAVLKALENNDKIAIYGDYDVDGVTATALLSEFFRRIGRETINYIPSRVDEGYGLNIEALTILAKQGVRLIITVDCGSTSFDVIDKANELGISVVVTDHHVLREEEGKMTIPTAVAVVNPKRMKPDCPLYELAGVSVAFYLVRALQSRMEGKYPQGQEKWLLDLVCLGTVCDIVPLIGENRILAKYGLSVLAKTRRVGIKALAQIAEVNLDFIDSYKIGFLLGPRLNAAGRIEHAYAALNLLLTEDNNEAGKLASELDELNRQRQEITEKIVVEAREMIEKEGKTQKIYLLSGKDWPAGVVGIVASRLTEEYGRPMLVMEDLGTELKGSARSVRGFNIISALSECGELLGRYGGHAFAAGFSLSKDKFVLLNDKLLQVSEDRISETDLEPEIDVDLAVTATSATKEFVEELSLLEPYGRGNNKPVFLLEKAKIVEAKLVGNPAVHLKLKVLQDSSTLSGIAFGYGEKLDIVVGNEYDLVVTFEINEWNMQKTSEFRLIDIKECVKTN